MVRTVQRREVTVETLVWEAAQRRDAALRSDPEARRRHGVVHTPPAVARGVVGVADELLRERFGLPAGVCDARVHVIDPACGPGAFLAAVLARAEAHGGHGPRMTGVDIDHRALEVAAALRAHRAAARLALRHADVFDAGLLGGAATTGDEVPVMLGNPPWTVARGRHGVQAQALLEDFRRDESGARLTERKLGVLSDAYVRFFRACAEVARHTRSGALLGLVSNASFLDGPVHRGMRAALREWFDELFVLDLGGSALLARSAAARDDNVFGVRPAVAITWLCRYPARSAREAARVHYARLSGDRQAKLATLASASLQSLPWRALAPEAPLWRFVPTRRRHADYTGYWSLAECMPFHREGVQSNRDAVAIDADPRRLLARLRSFAAAATRSSELEQAQRALAHYDPELARRRIREVLERDPDGERGLSVRPIAYRPFDERYFCPVPPLCHRPRPDLLAAFEHSACALISVRKDRGSLAWCHAAASVLPIDNCFLSARSSCRARAFPSAAPDGSENLEPRVRDALSTRAGQAIGTLDFLHYALAWLSSASYRTRWDEELRLDYPRVPEPSSGEVFLRMAALGRELAAVWCAPLRHRSGGSCQVTVDSRDVEQSGAEPSGVVRDAEWDASVGELVLDERAGGVMLRGAMIIAVSAEAQRLSIGHHRPLHAYIARHRTQRLAAASLSALREQAERLADLVRIHDELERVIQPSSRGSDPR